MAHVKNAIGMKKKIAGFVAILIGFVSFGLTPAFALDERVIDVVEVTWGGAPAIRGDAKVVAEVIDKDGNIIEARREAQTIFYSLKDENLKILKPFFNR